MTIIIVLLALILLAIVASQISVQGKGSTAFFVIVVVGFTVWMFINGLSR